MMLLLEELAWLAAGYMSSLDGAAVCLDNGRREHVLSLRLDVGMMCGTWVVTCANTQMTG